MGLTVGELLNRIDERELKEWHAYEKVCGPLGPARLDFLFAALQHTINRVNYGGKGEFPGKIQDYVPQWDVAEGTQQARRRPEMSPEQMKANFEGIARAYGKARNGRHIESTREIGSRRERI